ncbi:flagellar basal body rod protein FlgF [Novosphingobium lentum]|uniref:flagellar basal body rod protein FlgF n=1 Tax=Novosphingobium lentum TaxID=145287 RepID=UPI00082B8559|nr:flagellar basal body rod protein FlgF [Novosphingobium lentum]
MDRLIYTAFSGVSGSMVRQRVIASNMANAQTIGFRAETITSTPMTLKGPSVEARAMTDGEVHGASMKAGTMIETGNALDIALTGDDMLAVQAQDGEEAYTRRGDLSIDATGVLQNGDGRPVIGNAGPITVPLGSKVTIGPDGSVLVANPETPDLPPQPVDKLKLASPAGSKIAKGLDGLFRVIGGGVLPDNADGKVQTGTLEQSNVDATQVLVDMVEAQRLFDMRTKLVGTAKDIDEGGAALMRITS